jgi:hypothetical protein
MNREFKERDVILNYVRRDGLVIHDDKTFLLSIYEFLTTLFSIG